MGRNNSSLARGKATRTTRRRIIIFCEGSKTEPAYFKALKNRHEHVDVDTFPSGVPMTIAKEAVARLAVLRRSKDSFEKHDQVWAAFDRDTHPNFNEAVALCLSHGVRVCRSNPCFEVWLILHETDYDKPDDHNAVCAHLRSLRPEYDPSGSKTCDFDEMIERVERAEARAAKLLTRRQDQGAPFGRPSTTAGELTAAIREAAARHRPKR